jgi:FtsZ-binding cell division protein ZapB
MPDIFDSILAKISLIYELVKKIGNSDLLNKIGDLKMELAELKSVYAELKNENTQLKNQVQELTDNPLTLEGGVWRDKKGNAFCPACYANNPPLYAALRIEQGTDKHDKTWIRMSCPKCDRCFNEGPVPLPNIF